jgi:hypothetical protein
MLSVYYLEVLVLVPVVVSVPQYSTVLPVVVLPVVLVC